MNESIINFRSTTARTNRLVRYAMPAAILLVLLAAFLTYRTWNDRGADSTSPGAERISAAELEQRYGVRVRLIGVTAGGGMVDLRLKVLDVEKAKSLLQGPTNLPSLYVENSDITLKVPPDTARHDVKLKQDGIVFFLVPNTRGVIRPGTPVTLVFGDVSLEPITAQ